MPLLRAVVPYPPTGRPDQLMGEPGTDATQDAFLRASRPVSELYSEALATLRVDGYRSTLRLTCHATDEHDVRVAVLSSKVGLPDELGNVALPAAILGLDALSRARLALEVIHAAVVALAECRSWDGSQFQQCYDHVLANDFVYRWSGAWKSSPDRRHQARATYRLGADDGWGRVQLNVRGRNDDEATALSKEAVAFCTSEGFKRSARTLHWVDPDNVALTPYVGLLGETSGALTAQRTSAGWSFTGRDDVVVRQPAGLTATSGPDAVIPNVLASLYEAP